MAAGWSRATRPRLRPGYSWLVLPDGMVASFIDRCAAHGDLVFIGDFAPFARLQFAGDRVTLADAS